MKPLGILCTALALIGGTSGATAQALDRGRAQPTPLLEIYAARIKGEEMTQMGFDPQHPLMVIYRVSQVTLATDHKGVMLTLSEDDARAFAEMTHDYDGRPLIFKSGEVVRLVNINGAVADGKIGFKYPEAEATAAQLRRFFHLAEFKESDP